MNRQHVAVAIDGPSGAGKSSVARAAAGRFGFLYVDTGAIYRTVGLAAKRAGIDPGDAAYVAALLPSLHIELSYGQSGAQVMLLDGEDVSEAIRAPEISMAASAVAALPAVRSYLLDMQREMARRHDVIMDGRDIGTVVLPEAQVKIFLTASPEARARRRCLELEQKGVTVGFEEVLRDIEARDRQDAGRAAAPLKQAEDAFSLDTSELDFEASVAAVSRLISEKTGRVCA